MARLERTEGFTPDLIGRVVSVVVVPVKEGGVTRPEHAQRTIGTLKAYYKNDRTNSGSFIIDGYAPRQYGIKDQVTVYILARDGYVKYETSGDR